MKHDDNLRVISLVLQHEPAADKCEKITPGALGETLTSFSGSLWIWTVKRKFQVS